MGRKTCDIAIELDPIPHPFYGTGDTVSGRVRLDVRADSVLVKDVQVKVCCNEYSEVAADEKHRQAMLDKREAKHAKAVARRARKGHAAGAKDTFTAPPPPVRKESHRHIELTSEVFVAEDFGGARQPLRHGTHTFAFRIVLSEAVNMLPPHSPVPTRNGLKIGVEWTVEVVARRAESFTSDLRAKTAIPVHPTRTISGLGDLSRRAELSRQRVLGKHKSRGYSSKFLGISYGYTFTADYRERGQMLIVRLGYPEVGIPQGPIKPRFSLMLAAPNEPITVTAVTIYLVQRCVATVDSKRPLNDVYRNMYALGEARTVREIGTEPADLSDLVADFKARDVYAAPFASNLLTLSYELRVAVECASRSKNEPHIVNVEVPVNLLGPAVCWASRSARRYDAHARVPPPSRGRYTDSDSSSGSDQEPDESHSHGLPTYDETVPSHTRVIDENTYQSLKQ